MWSGHSAGELRTAKSNVVPAVQHSMRQGKHLGLHGLVICKTAIFTTWGERESSREGWLRHRMDVPLNQQQH